MSPLELLVAGATVAIGSCVQGALGFGFALIGAPVLALIDPHLVPVPLSLASLLLAGGTSYRLLVAADRPPAPRLRRPPGSAGRGHAAVHQQRGGAHSEAAAPNE